MPGPKSGKEVSAEDALEAKPALEADDGVPGAKPDQGKDGKEDKKDKDKDKDKKKKEEKKTWAEFQLLDNAGAPVKSEKCKLTLPDGSEKTIKTSGEGVVRVENIPEGKVIIQFPDRYDYEWVFERVEK
ncbi:MAG TPA: hypothetical protein ENN05_11200 [Deltaproteobacteria bacterium]|mgnify:CR=1 FL=1|nr:hypothetical protein [Deltaproteobacteria bacterium]